MVGICIRVCNKHSSRETRINLGDFLGNLNGSHRKQSYSYHYHCLLHGAGFLLFVNVECSCYLIQNAMPPWSTLNARRTNVRGENAQKSTVTDNMLKESRIRKQKPYPALCTSIQLFIEHHRLFFVSGRILRRNGLGKSSASLSH